MRPRNQRGAGRNYVGRKKGGREEENISWDGDGNNKTGKE
jgi:hypothetical protein